MACSRSATLKSTLLLFAIGVIGSGCVLSQATSGTGLSEEQVAEIVVGVSTRADVAKALGAPDEIIYSNLEHDPLFERAYRYTRKRSKTTFFTVILFSGARSDVNHDQVIVFFDDQGTVDDLAARLDMDKPRYGGPWGDDNK